jgi:hypothetical protein
MFRQFSAADAEAILRASEGNATGYRGSGAPGHAGKQHLLLSNEQLLARYDTESRRFRSQNGRLKRSEFTLITAFSNLGDMIGATEAILNAGQTQAALLDFFKNTPRGPRMRAVIKYHGTTSYRTRYAQGVTAVRTMPVNDLLMVLDRVDDAPFALQVQTLFGILPEAAANQSEVFTSAGKPLKKYQLPV